MAEKPIVKVVVAVPNEGCTHPAGYDNRMQFMLHLGRLEERSKTDPSLLEEFRFFHFTAGRLLTPIAREALADNAIKECMDYMLMIDDDMIIPMDMFENLYRHQVDIVAPLAFTRNPPHLPVIYRCESGYDPVTRSEYFINHYARHYPKNKLVRCDAVGFGAALIKMDVFKKMKKPYFLAAPTTGEDVAFCYQAQKVGAKVYMDTSIKLGHLGHPIVITEDYAEGYWRDIEKRDVQKEHGVMNKYEAVPV